MTESHGVHFRRAAVFIGPAKEKMILPMKERECRGGALDREETR
jgi:hypothetical protein